VKLNELLKANRIMVNVEAEDWERVIDVGASLLLKEGMIEPRYIDAIKETKKTMGPYIVIAPGIAIPHSKPEDGVLKTGMSFIKLKEPVYFGHIDNDPVRIVFTLASIDRNTHLAALKQLMNILMDNEELEKLFNSQSIDEIVDVINKHSQN